MEYRGTYVYILKHMTQGTSYNITNDLLLQLMPAIPLLELLPSKVTYQAFFWVLIDLIIELLDLIIKGLDNQTDIFIDLRLIIKPFDNQPF